MVTKYTVNLLKEETWLKGKKYIFRTAVMAEPIIIL